MSNVDKGAIELGHGWPGGAYCCRREGGFPTAHHRPGSAQGLDHTVPIFATNHPTDRPVTTNFPSKRTFAHLHTQAASLLTQWRTLLFVQIWQRNVTPSLFKRLFSLNTLKGFFILRTLRSWTRGGCEIPCALWVESLKKIVLKCLFINNWVWVCDHT